MRYSSYVRLVDNGWYYLLGKEYIDNSEILIPLVPTFGITNKFIQYFFLVNYESHNSDFFLNYKFIDFELIRFNNAFIKFAKFFPAFKNFYKFQLYYCTRAFCINSRKRKLFLNKLPLRGQRNRSNSSTIRKDSTVHRKYATAIKILKNNGQKVSKDIFLYDRADQIIKSLAYKIERQKSLELKQNRVKLKFQKKKQNKPKQKKKKFNVWG